YKPKADDKDFYHQLQLKILKIITQAYFFKVFDESDSAILNGLGLITPLSNAEASKSFSRGFTNFNY
ncbi:MAG: hypothetical protein LBJ09_01150, partial [Clostridiales bacterium]|nr:hypothetical protein [Clostridiales bacterium]